MEKSVLLMKMQKFTTKTGALDTTLETEAQLRSIFGAKCLKRIHPMVDCPPGVSNLIPHDLLIYYSFGVALFT